ncbi:MAG: hypothetical protein R3C53_01655 [Pirellulaceae bacterium]
MAPPESAKPAEKPQNRKSRQRAQPSIVSQLVSTSSMAECDDDETDGSLSEFFGGALLTGLSSPFWAPRAMIGDESSDPGFFLRYPYLHDRDGALSEQQHSVAGTRTWMLRARGEYVDDFDSLSKIGGGLLCDTASRWGIDSEYNYRREELSTANDSLWTGDFNLVYRFAQSEQLQMRTGIGLNWLADRVDNDLGFNFTYAGDWFPTRPVIVSHEIDWGKLGHAALFHARVTAGINYHRLEVYTGYDYLDVGQSKFDGLVGGVRLWLSH